MIRFRNPGTQYTTQIQVFRELYKEYKDAESFGLEDMADTIAKCRLMTAYGYAGDAAIALSNTDNTSLNSVLMNAKMYAEVFRLLGWIASKEDHSSYPLVFTYIGEHAASVSNVLPLYEQCVLGINNPQEIMDVKYTEKVRFFKAALCSLIDLDGHMYKHEFCLGPMSIDDLDSSQYAKMIANIKKLRGDYKRLTGAYEGLCKSLGVKKTLPDNSTRLPIAFMKACGWVESERTSCLYPPKPLECLRITSHGRAVVASIREKQDVRLDEYKQCNPVVKKALIRLGIYSMLECSGYDISPVSAIIASDKSTCEDILQGKDILFSPYQTLRCSEVDDALGIIRTNVRKTSAASVNTRVERIEANIEHLNLCVAVLETKDDLEIASFTNRISALEKKGLQSEEIANCLFKDCISDTQTSFYPFVAMLFRVMGFDCQASRPGDNGARWDAIIVHPEQSIPIEIKSPTEELHLSMKAIRQALENKVILLSRKTHQTMADTTSLAVGYYLPNDRAEVSSLIRDIRSVYGYKIGVIDIKTLITVAVSIIQNGKTFDWNELFGLEGFADAVVG